MEDRVRECAKTKMGGFMKKTIVAGLACTTLGTPAWAQTATDGAAVADPEGEIIVTANKRSERLNDVPISITAATGEQLDNLGVAAPADLVKVVPGFTYRPSE